MRTEWMTWMDLPAVLAIEASLRDPLTEQEFVETLQHRPTSLPYGDTACVMAVDRDHRRVGYALYRYHPRCIEVMRLAVLPGDRRRGAGAALVGFVQNKLCLRRKYIQYVVPEWAPDVCRLLLSCGVDYVPTPNGVPGEYLFVDRGLVALSPEPLEACC